MRNSKIILFLIYTSWIVLISSSCEEERQHPVPDVYVNFVINLSSDPEFLFLRTQGASAIITSSTIGALSLGYLNNGIIIYNAGDGEFMAFDRTCPYDLPESFVVETETYSGMATCPNCGSIFVFPSMGAPTTDSPSNWALKQYAVMYNPNTFELLVSN
jgi:hypothetical protein